MIQPPQPVAALRAHQHRWERNTANPGTRSLLLECACGAEGSWPMPEPTDTGKA